MPMLSKKSKTLSREFVPSGTDPRKSSPGKTSVLPVIGADPAVRPSSQPLSGFGTATVAPSSPPSGGEQPTPSDCGTRTATPPPLPPRWAEEQLSKTYASAVVSNPPLPSGSITSVVDSEPTPSTSGFVPEPTLNQVLLRENPITDLDPIDEDLPPIAPVRELTWAEEADIEEEEAKHRPLTAPLLKEYPSLNRLVEVGKSVSGEDLHIVGEVAFYCKDERSKALADTIVAMEKMSNVCHLCQSGPSGFYFKNELAYYKACSHCCNLPKNPQCSYCDKKAGVYTQVQRQKSRKDLWFLCHPCITKFGLAPEVDDIAPEIPAALKQPAAREGAAKLLAESIENFVNIPTPLLGRVLPMLANEVRIYRCLTTEQFQRLGMRAKKWILRTLVANDNLPPSVLRIENDEKLLFQFANLIVLHLPKLPIRDIQPTFDTESEELALKMYQEQHPDGEKEAIYEGIHQISPFRHGVKTDTGLPARDIEVVAKEISGALEGFLSQLTKNQNRIAIGLNAAAIASQIYLLATDDLTGSPLRKAAYVVGLTSSICCAGISIAKELNISFADHFVTESFNKLFSRDEPKLQSVYLANKLLRIVMLGFVLAGCKDVINRAKDMHIMLKSADEMTAELEDTFEHFRDWFTDGSLDLAKSAEKMSERLSRLASLPISAFLRAAHAAEVAQALRDCTALMGRFNVAANGVGTRAGAAKSILGSLGRAAAAVEARRTEAFSCDIGDNMVRPEPVMINIWGEPGQGKTTWVNNVLIPFLQKEFSLQHGIVTATGTSDFAPLIGLQEILVIDEFGARVNDAWVPRLNGIISEGNMAMDAAFAKNQVPVFRFVITISNVDPAATRYEDCGLKKEADNAFRTRLWSICFQNRAHDAKKGRFGQDRFDYAFSQGTIINTGKDDIVRYRPITEGGLFEELRRRHIRSDKAYEARLAAAGARLLEDKKQAAQPTFVSINGPPGSGKSTLAAQIASNLSIVLQLQVVPVVKFEGAPSRAIFLVDDGVLAAQDKFVRWSSRLPAGSVVISTNNLKFVRHTPAWPVSYLSKPYMTIKATGQEVKTPGVPRRLGYSGRVLIRSEMTDSIGTPNLCYSMKKHIVKETHLGEKKLTNLENICGQIVRAYYDNAEPEVRYEAGPELDNYDIDIKVENFNTMTMAQAMKFPTATSYIKLAPKISEDELQRHFAALSGVKGIDEAIPVLKEVLRIRPHWTCRVICPLGTMIVCGNIYFPPHAAPAPLQFTEREDGWLVGKGKVFFSWAELGKIATGAGACTTLLAQLSDREVHSLSLYISKARMKGHAKITGIEMKSAVATYVEQGTDAINSVAQWIWNWMREHKLISLAIGLTTVCVFIKSTRNGRRTASYEIEDSGYRVYIPGESPIFVNPTKHQSEPDAVPPKKVSNDRRVIIDDDMDEDEMEREIDAARRAYAKKMGWGPKEDLQAIRAFTSRTVADDQILDTIVEKIKNATCFVSCDGNYCRGIMIGGPCVLSNAHVYTKGGTVLIREDENTHGYAAKLVGRLKDRDLALFVVIDKDFRLRPSLQKFFIKDSDLTEIDGARVIICEPDHTTIMGGVTTFKTRRLGRETTGEIHVDNQNFPSFTMYWAHTSQIPTRAGDCGSPYVSTTRSLAQRRIMGIHAIGNAAERYTRCAICTQEDLEALCSTLQSAGTGIEGVRFVQNPLPVTGPGFSVEKAPKAIRDEDVKWLGATVVDEIAVFENDKPSIDLKDTERFAQLNHYKSAYRPAGSRSNYKRCILSSMVDLPDVTAPAPFSAKSLTPENRDNLVKRDGFPSLLATQIKNLTTDHAPIDQALLMEVEDHVFNRFAHVFSGYKMLNLHEVLNGIPGVVGSIDLSKSAGSAGMRTKKNTKKEYFMREENGLIRFNSSEAAKDVRDHYEKISECARRGIHLVEPIEARNKDELLPVEKVKIGKVRLFENVGLATFLFQRKVLSHFLQKAELHRIETPWTTGYNPYKETFAIYESLLEVSETGEAGDFSRFDKNIHLAIQDSAARLCGRWASIGKNKEETQTLMNIFKVVFEQNARELHIGEGTLYWTNGSFNSGCYGTNFFDGLFNVIMHYYVCRTLLPAEHSTFRLIDAYTRFFVNGDDIVRSIHPSIQRWVNFHTLKEAYKKIGMIYDTPDKDGAEGLAIVKVKDMSFSSRSFRPENGYVFGALKRSSIDRLFHWTKSNHDDELVARLEIVTLEAFMHGEKVYDEYANVIRKVREQFFQHYRKHLPFVPQSYSAFFRELFSGAVQWPGLDKLKNLSEEFQKFSPDTKIMSFHCGIATKNGPCNNVTGSAEAHRHHVCNSHPKTDKQVECGASFCSFQGYPKDFAGHSCEYFSGAECTVCKLQFSTYEKAARHHYSAHQRYCGCIGEYFAKPHPQLIPLRQPLQAEVLQQQQQYSAARKGETEQLTAKARLRVALTRAQRRRSRASDDGLDELLDEFQKFLSIRGTLDPNLQSGRGKSSTNISPSGMPSTGISTPTSAEGRGTTVPLRSGAMESMSVTPVTNVTSPELARVDARGEPVPDNVISVDDALLYEMPGGLMPEMIALSGPNNSLDVQKWRNQTILTGSTDSTTRRGQVLATLIYGTKQIYSELALNEWLLKHNDFSGSVQLLFRVAANYSISGTIIVGWLPYALGGPDYVPTADDLRRFGVYNVLTLQGTSSVGFVLNDIRQTKLWRKTSEILDANDPANADELATRPRLVMIQDFEVTAGFQETLSVSYDILSCLHSNTFVNNFKGTLPTNAATWTSTMPNFLLGLDNTATPFEPPVGIEYSLGSGEVVKREAGTQPTFLSLPLTFNQSPESGIAIRNGGASTSETEDYDVVLLQGDLPVELQLPWDECSDIQDYLNVKLSSGVELGQGVSQYNWTPPPIKGWTIVGDKSIPVRSELNQEVSTLLPAKVWRFTQQKYDGRGEVGVIVIWNSTFPLVSSPSGGKLKLSVPDSVVDQAIIPSTTITPYGMRRIVGIDTGNVTKVGSSNFPVFSGSEAAEEQLKLLSAAAYRAVPADRIWVDVSSDDVTFGTILIEHNKGSTNTKSEMYANFPSQAYFNASGLVFRNFRATFFGSPRSLEIPNIVQVPIISPRGLDPIDLEVCAMRAEVAALKRMLERANIGQQSGIGVGTVAVAGLFGAASGAFNAAGNWMVMKQTFEQQNRVIDQRFSNQKELMLLAQDFARTQNEASRRFESSNKVSASSQTVPEQVPTAPAAPVPLEEPQVADNWADEPIYEDIPAPNNAAMQRSGIPVTPVPAESQA